jgi:hypothetical protein
MFSMLKVAGVLSCGVVLGFGLSQTAHALEGEGANRLAQAKVITGNLVRIDYGDHTVKDKDGREVHVQVTKKTQIMGQLAKGDRVEAKVDDQNIALSIRSLP